MLAHRDLRHKLRIEHQRDARRAAPGERRVVVPLPAAEAPPESVHRQRGNHQQGDTRAAAPARRSAPPRQAHRRRRLRRRGGIAGPVLQARPRDSRPRGPPPRARRRRPRCRIQKGAPGTAPRCAHPAGAPLPPVAAGARIEAETSSGEPGWGAARAPAPGARASGRRGGPSSKARAGHIAAGSSNATPCGLRRVRQAVTLQCYALAGSARVPAKPSPSRKKPRLGRVGSVGGALRMAGGIPVLPLQASPVAARERGGACTPRECRNPWLQLSGTRSATHHEKPGRGSVEALRNSSSTSKSGAHGRCCQCNIAPTPRHP